MQPQYVQQASEFAQKTPLTFVIILLASLLAALVASLVWGAWRGVPKLLDWIEKRQVAGHEQQAKLLTDLRSDNAADVSRAEKALADAHEKIGREVRSSGDQLGAKLAEVHSDVRRIAAKIGASILALTLSGAFGVVLGLRLEYERASRAEARRIHACASPLLAVTCSPACSKGSHCTKEGKCEPDDTAPASKPDAKPARDEKKSHAVSGVPDAGAWSGYVFLRGYADGACNDRIAPCARM